MARRARQAGTSKSRQDSTTGSRAHTPAGLTFRTAKSPASGVWSSHRPRQGSLRRSGARWPNRLVATAAEERLSIQLIQCDDVCRLVKGTGDER